jgi:excisionase family DNA binding protein
MTARSAPTAAAGSSAHDGDTRRAADPPAATKGSLLTVNEACALLQLSRAAFYAYRRRHGIPNAIHGRALRVRRADLEVAQFREETDALAARLVDFAELGRQHARGGLH